ncbi:MAG TPA: bis(5'-nucleosyl)-tetraphosphatase (symmetrical) YqeK [Clostridia bacterium]|nr:bis(5'-nucleosyl)-tetraphosphatase (symmetrical) YqeK [Clostridia bacterium]
MTSRERARIVALVAQRVSQKRLEHTLRVETLAVALARFWGVSEDKVILASLLHDVARDEAETSLLELARGSSDPVVRGMAGTSAPVVLHAPVGALIARRNFGVQDPQILQAIALHTTGGPHMDRLAMIVFLADYCESGRSFAGVDDVRLLLFASLEDAMLRALEQTLTYLRQNGRPIDPNTAEAAMAFAHPDRGDSQRPYRA